MGEITNPGRESGEQKDEGDKDAKAHSGIVERDISGPVLLGFAGEVRADFREVVGCRPAADVTMQSAAKVYGRRTLGVVMTGMGKDGTAGALAIKKVDGKTLAQDQQTSVIYGMPKAAIEAGAIDEVAALGDIATWMRYA